jgi:hypothetical protein
MNEWVDPRNGEKVSRRGEIRPRPHLHRISIWPFLSSAKMCSANRSVKNKVRKKREEYGWMGNN